MERDYIHGLEDSTLYKDINSHQIDILLFLSNAIFQNTKISKSQQDSFVDMDRTF